MNWEREAVTPPGTKQCAAVGRAGAVLGVVALIIMVVGRRSPRTARRRSSKRSTEAQAVVTVATIKPAAQAELAELVLPGNIQANYEAPIYARTSGYLKRWLVDIGTPVKAGQLLAEIESPEVDSATAPGASGPRHRPSQPEDRRPDRRAVAQSARERLGLQAGGRREDQPRRFR